MFDYKKYVHYANGLRDFLANVTDVTKLRVKNGQVTGPLQIDHHSRFIAGIKLTKYFVLFLLTSQF